MNTAGTRRASRVFKKRFRLARSRQWSRARVRTVLGTSTAVLAFILLLAHGFKSEMFMVDSTSIGLLGFVALPYLSLVVTSFKAVGVELSFRELTVHDQVLTFLDGIAVKRQWTFFQPRASEAEFGAAFVELTGELVRNARAELLPQLSAWLKSENPNYRWFAAEIVGFHRIRELYRTVKTAPDSIDRGEPWETWELNCLWAASRMEDPQYQRLRQFLLETSVSANQKWVLRAFDQMIEAGEAQPDEFDDVVSKFVSDRRVSGLADRDINTLFEGLGHLRSGAHEQAQAV
jgi:hypothetical protein